MRIISGQWKSHKLISFEGEHIRPTTDRVKESLFNHIQFEVEGGLVLDLFSGTGNLGIEALSRGARHVTFVDSHPKSLEITKKNLQLLKVPSDRFSIVKSEALSFLKKQSQKLSSVSPYDLILLDPPFTKAMAHDLLQCLASYKELLSPSGGRIAIESARKERLEAEYGDLLRYSRKEFGDKILSWFTHRDLLRTPEC